MRGCDHSGGSATLLLAAALIAGCNGHSSIPALSAPISGDSSAPAAAGKAYDADSSVNPALIAADDGFGLKLLAAIVPGTSGNVSIAPVSVAMGLQIVYDGAAGASAQAMAQAMAQTLQLGSLTAADVNTANAALQASLIDPDPTVQITVANSLWLKPVDNPVSSAFTQTVGNYYGATIGDLSGAPANVNAWVAAETHGLITQILAPEPPSYYQQLIAIVANAIYFKDVDHATLVEVDESGTVAAGATTVGATITAVVAPQFTMTMNRPFFYAIRDDDNGELLFVGVLEDPTS